MFIWKYLSAILFYITLPFFYLERVIHKKNGGWKSKFGFCDEIKSEKGVIMVHGCSVGEITAVEDLIKRIKRDFPDNKLIVTTSTLTGQEIAKKKFSEIADYITFFPFDIQSSVKRFLKRINPSVVLIAETEIWPNFAYNCKKNNIPLYIINGRISDSSFGMYRIGKLFFKEVFNFYSGIFTQSNEDSKKFVSLGMNSNKVEFMGNLKFGIVKTDSEIDLGQNGYKVWLAGSTHKPENSIVIDTFSKLKNDHAELKLLIAPRHLERVSDIESLCDKYNLKYGKRSNSDVFSDNVDVIILDTLGELKYMYSISYIAFIGGSFNKTGGHNPLEASICRVPVLSGPQIFNFKDIYSILTKAGAAKIVKTQHDLYDEMNKLLNNESVYIDAQNACDGVFKEQQGATDFVINILKRIQYTKEKVANN